MSNNNGVGRRTAWLEYIEYLLGGPRLDSHQGKRPTGREDLALIEIFAGTATGKDEDLVLTAGDRVGLGGSCGASARPPCSALSSALTMELDVDPKG